MTVEEASGDAVGIWPDNLQAVNTFVSMSTQWRANAAGPYGLDYNVLYRKLDRLGLSPADYDAIDEDIRTMEDAALVQIRANK